MSKSFESTWNNCLTVIKDNVSIQAFKTWFEPIKPVKLKSNVLTIQVPSQFFYEWLEEHYVDLLKKTIRKEIGSEAKLEYSIVMENNIYDMAAEQGLNPVFTQTWCLESSMFMLSAT